MSSLVIGLDISDNQISSALVRIEELSKKNLSIERDTYYSRSFEINSDTDPRDIISIWIQCIDDLLQDFIKNYEENDNIIGISIGIPSPMDYESGTCYIQSSRFKKFFGLNLRLSFESGIKKLISRWKHDYYDKHYTSSPTEFLPKKPTILDELKQYEPKRITITSSTPPHTPLVLYFLPTVEVPEYKFSKRNLTDYCGRHFDDKEIDFNEEKRVSIPRSRRETYFHDIEISPIKKSETTDHFNPKIWSVIEQLANIPISFYNDTTCFALGEANHVDNQNYERILALTLNSNLGSAFIDRGEIITNREDIPLNGTLWNCPYDKHSIANDWFSTRGLVNIYTKILRNESPDDSSGTSSMTVSSDERQPYD